MLQEPIHLSGDFEMGNNPGQGLGEPESPKKQQEPSSPSAHGSAEKPGLQSSIEKTVSDKTKGVTDTVSAAATQAKDKLKEMGGQLTDSVGELSGQVKEKAQQWASEAGDAMSHAKRCRSGVGNRCSPSNGTSSERFWPRNHWIHQALSSPGVDRRVYPWLSGRQSIQFV